MRIQEQLTPFTRNLCCAVLFLACLALPCPVNSQTLQWQESKSNAVSLARSQGKRVLLLAGRHSCPNCQYMLGTVCEAASPPIKQLLLDRYVPWFCEIDASSEWHAYAGGLGSFTLPLMCCIDPAKPDEYIDRSTGIQSPQPFYDRLAANAGSAPTNAILTSFRVSNGVADVAIDRLTFGTTNVIEHSSDLRTWTPVATFVSTTRSTNWSWAVSDPKAFFLLISR